jgi:hypothetical protein
VTEHILCDSHRWRPPTFAEVLEAPPDEVAANMPHAQLEYICVECDAHVWAGHVVEQQGGAS